MRYIGQHANLATFSLQSYSYPAGAAHGIHHQEFVTFDLKTEKAFGVARYYAAQYGSQNDRRII